MTEPTRDEEWPVDENDLDDETVLGMWNERYPVDLVPPPDSPATSFWIEDTDTAIFWIGRSTRPASDLSVNKYVGVYNYEGTFTFGEVDQEPTLAAAS